MFVSTSARAGAQRAARQGSSVAATAMSKYAAETTVASIGLPAEKTRPSRLRFRRQAMLERPQDGEQSAQPRPEHNQSEDDANAPQDKRLRLPDPRLELEGPIAELCSG